jgi:hypothetical protein
VEAVTVTSGITRPMVELLRWYAHAPAERKRRWKERPHPNRAQKLALVRRRLVTSVSVPAAPYEIIDDRYFQEPDRITDEGRRLLKLIDRNPHAWMPRK